MHCFVAAALSHTVFGVHAGYAAQSLLAAIGCVQFVSNVMFASWVLKEQVRRRQLCEHRHTLESCRKDVLPLCWQQLCGHSLLKNGPAKPR